MLKTHHKLIRWLPMSTDTGPNSQPPIRDAAEQPHPSRWCCGTCQRGWVCWERWERPSEERWEGNSAEMHEGVAKSAKTSTSGPCHLPWIPLPNVNALACRRGQSLKSDFGSSVLLMSVCSPILCDQLMGLWQCLLFSWVPVYSGHHLRII